VSGRFVLSRDKRFGAGLTGWPEGDMDRPFELVRFSLDDTRSETLSSHGPQVSVALDPTGTLVATGRMDGTVRIGPISGEEPCVFLRHRGQGVVRRLLSRRGFLAPATTGRILLWPMPELSKPPFQSGLIRRFCRCFGPGRTFALFPTRLTCGLEARPRSIPRRGEARGPVTAL
jgi:hypothetical protein